MEKRKLIACIMNCPENIYQQRTMDGLMARCEEYGYDLAVFSPLVNAVHFYKDYLYAECNILELINFDMFDAVVVVSLPLIAMNDDAMFRRVEQMLKKRCRKPVVCLDMPMADYPTVYTDDRSAFVKITHHVIDVHKCEKIYFLAGSQVEGVEDSRLAGFLDGMEQCGREVKEEEVFFGDFWYSSGQQLAERIISGELAMPDAVICGSDHMAIGLANALIDGGVKVPEQVIVTGFDATQEALMNECSITTYSPDNFAMAVKAIDLLRNEIDAGEPILPVSESDEDNMCIGLSCGCHMDFRHLIRKLSGSLYRINRDFGDKTVNNSDDLYHLMDSYMLEALTESKTPEEYLCNIDQQVYLIHPLDHFYLCLRPNWLDTETMQKDGYPRKMRCNIHSISHEMQLRGDVEYFYTDDDRMLFDTKLMHPALYEYHEKPNVFYFIPVHFQQNTLGYAVVQSELSKRMKMTGVVRNWMRNINNALQMSRVNHRLVDDSEVDRMTGVKNRRGMDIALKKLLKDADKKDHFYAIVFDLDGLKNINDNYGHNEGDFAITSIANAVAKVTNDNEVAVRAGGDEFYLIGVGKNITEKTMIDKVSKYRGIVDEINRLSGKPYEICASVGFCMKCFTEVESISDVIREADRHMYLCKAENKKNRRR